MAGLRIPKKKKMSINNKLTAYVKPNKVYIPLVDEDMNILTKKGEHVFKGQVLAKRKNSFETPVFSSVSGTIANIEEVSYQNGKKVKALAIENDYKEEIEKKYELRKNINKMDKQEFIDILKECGIVGMGGAGFPTFMKYKTDQKIKTLLINAVECEPYITADYTIIMEKIEEILETIDHILSINGIEEAIIAIKECNTALIEKVEKYLGTYLKIKVCPVRNIYPMGWERTLIKEVKNCTYDKLPIEKGIIVNNVSTIYAISQALKYNKPIIERIVTFTGEGLRKPQNVLVKLGTKVSDVINNIGGTKDNIFYVSNGPMMGTLIDNDLVVTADLNCVLVLENKKDVITKECLRCGKCANFCPANLCPVLIKDNINNPDKLKELHPEKCISCGLCSYICPSKIDVREYIKKAKESVKGGK
ncbi:MAG TPA: RnfABCDGE type electron transport complex subunit C [Bacilli bacterium]|nr:RnfABCDGE type electron transport complex subunit C [Bacilli bacterium]